jgi:aminopeptidase N
MHRKDSILTHEMAIARGNSIIKDSISYDVELSIPKGKSYSGKITIEFSCTGTDQVFLEYSGQEFTILAFNGEDWGPSDNGSYEGYRTDGRIFFPTDKIRIGDSTKNTLTMIFTNEYYTDGCGIHSFTDIDGSQYIYTSGEPHWINRVFPVFDQPDLKATMKWTILAHPDWKVISNTSPTLKNISQQTNQWNFPPTLRLPSYLFAILAGPFREIICPSEKCHKNIPQSIFCRDTLYKYVSPQQHDIFAFNSEAIRRYEDLFGYPYPFCKADSVFCPEFSHGAME